MSDSLPSGWNRVKLGDVALERTERENDPANSAFDRFVGSNHIGRFELTLSNWGSTDDVSSAMKVFHPGDYLFVRRSLYASDFRERAARTSFAGLCSGDILPLRERPGKIADGFLMAVLNHPAIWAFVVKHATGSITRRIKWKQLREYEFALPPLEEQRRIADTFGAVHRAVEARQTTMKAIRLLSESTLVDLMERGVRGRDGGSVDTWVGSFPAHWQQKKLADIANIVRGSTPRPAGDPRYFNGRDVPWITVKEITGDEDWVLTQTESSLTREGATRSRRMKSGTVLLANSGWTLGVPKILGIDGCANDGVAAFFELAPIVKPEFLFLYLKNLTEVFRKVVAAGGDQPNLNTTRIGNVPIGIPPIDEQEEIIRVMKAIEERRKDLEQEFTRLQAVASAVGRTALVGGVTA